MAIGLNGSAEVYSDKCDPVQWHKRLIPGKRIEFHRERLSVGWQDNGAVGYCVAIMMPDQDSFLANDVSPSSQRCLLHTEDSCRM